MLIKIAEQISPSPSAGHQRQWITWVRWLWVIFSGTILKPMSLNPTVYVTSHPELTYVARAAINDLCNLDGLWFHNLLNQLVPLLNTYELVLNLLINASN